MEKPHRASTYDAGVDKETLYHLIYTLYVPSYLLVNSEKIKKIEGMQVLEKECKIKQFADDITLLFEVDQESYEELF
jgi:hypothetical protein